MIFGLEKWFHSPPIDFVEEGLNYHCDQCLNWSNIKNKFFERVRFWSFNLIY